MNAILPDTYDMALQQALAERGFKKAAYVAGIEQENLELRRLLRRLLPFAPHNLQKELALHAALDAEGNPYEP